MDADLTRFAEAQAPIRERITAELTEGQKRSHWMWFVFPQLIGLGRSSMAQQYAIKDVAHARRYLADPVLGERLRLDVRLMLSHKNRSALRILGSPDDLKFHSCLTLFHTAASNQSDSALFAEALAQFYDGKSDERTLELLG
jgi:uncharacterized protein (DUF1810 family)